MEKIEGGVCHVPYSKRGDLASKDTGERKESLAHADKVEGGMRENRL